MQYHPTWYYQEGVFTREAVHYLDYATLLPHVWWHPILEEECTEEGTQPSHWCPCCLNSLPAFHHFHLAKEIREQIMCISEHQLKTDEDCEKSLGGPLESWKEVHEPDLWLRMSWLREFCHQQWLQMTRQERKSIWSSPQIDTHLKCVCGISWSLPAFNYLVPAEEHSPSLAGVCGAQWAIRYHWVAG